jgi:hypothetical protein
MSDIRTPIEELLDDDSCDTCITEITDNGEIDFFEDEYLSSIDSAEFEKDVRLEPDFRAVGFILENKEQMNKLHSESHPSPRHNTHDRTQHVQSQHVQSQPVRQLSRSLLETHPNAGRSPSPLTLPQ